jgi:hypothetical protein
MNAFSLRACGRILWREAAEQYAFCIGIFALLITLQASLATMETFDMIRSVDVAFGFGMALFMTAIYTAASGALLLTAETDAGTFSFQRTRPIGWITYLWGKLSWVVLSSLLFGLVAWLETAVWLGVFPSARDASFAFGVSGVGILEGLTWGLMASVLIRQPLRAVVAGIALASLGAWVTVAIHHTATGGGTVAVTTAYYEAAAVRLIVAAVVLAIAVPLVRIWYRTGQPLRLPASPRVTQDAADTVAIAGQWDACVRPCRGRWIRLVWHAWREIRTLAVVYWGLCLAVGGAAGLRVLSRVASSPREPADVYLGGIATTTFAVVAFSSLLAGYTFGADQKARFLQLARDGVSPWEVWLSRLAVMAAVLLPPAIVVYVSYWAVLSAYDHLAMFRPLATLLVVLGFVSVLTIGQACSMYVRSRIVGVLAAPVMTGCFAFWVGTGVIFLGLGWKLGATPLLLALLIGSRLLASARLRQDDSWRAMRVPALLVVVAVVFTYQALAHHRVSEIRPYDSVSQLGGTLGWPWQAMKENAKDERETEPHAWMEHVLVTLGHVYGTNPSSALRRPWDENSQRPHTRLRAGAARGYWNMLFVDAHLNAMLRDVTGRSEIPNDRLRAAIEFLEDWGKQRTGCAEWLAADCQRDMVWLQEGPRKNADGKNKYDKHGFHCKALPWRYRWLSFERERALRLLDRAFRIGADRATEYERAIIHDQAVEGLQGRPNLDVDPWGFEQPQRLRLLRSHDLVPYDPARPVWYQASSLDEVFRNLRWQFRLFDSLDTLEWSLRGGLYTAEAQRRGTILYLALRMYVNDHGRLPESLDALVEGKYLARLPVIPIAREPFYFAPDGASEELNRAIEECNANRANLVGPFGADVSFLGEHDKSKPFLWYPAGPAAQVDPGAVPGVFIDLDFVK